MKPFFIPKIKNEKDLRYIDKIFTDESPVDTPVESSHLSFIQKRETHFKGFTYSKENPLNSSPEISRESLENVTEEIDEIDTSGIAEH